ncbi:TPA: hypothetical protein N0F65_010335 [Lagenidium giganteum]|uniref:Uncharacterized protein n=1 Tax=Lagenidium giganteum TaxID=4803 RepID=A0AAV2Z820_9STRA|nr:TPA: hypothetical protein N0F65_010335 [Lagenidium giganteum]
MPTPMDIDGTGEEDRHSKVVTPAKRDHGCTNIETLTDKINQITISQLAKEQQKKESTEVHQHYQITQFHS